MFSSSKWTASLIMSVFVITAGVMAVSLDVKHGDPVIEEHVERACHRMIESRSPHGQREMKTLVYDLETPHVGIAKGSFQTKIVPKHWAQINWTCRVHPKSGRVLRVEFGQSSGASRLLAAAAAF